MNRHWLFGILGSAVLTLLIVSPQFALVYVRGEKWEGNYALTDGDEVAYAGYLQALIDGQGRRNDPFLEKADTATEPLPESLFSIQFASAYLVAVPSKLLGISTPIAMITVGALSAFLSVFLLFSLVSMFTRDPVYALMGTLVVFCFGSLAAGQGGILHFLDYRFPGPFFPAFRRYIPAVPMVVFFVLILLLWRLFGETRTHARRYWGFVAGASVCFGILVFSYLYLWTAAAAWICCLLTFWILFKPDGWRDDLKAHVLLGGLCTVFVVPWAILVLNRGATTDEVQLIVQTRAPDLSWPSEYLGMLVFLLLAIGVWANRIEVRNKRTLFAASFALVPFIVHNQQILTGQEVQPFHYDVFVVNYMALLALVLACWLLLEGRTGCSRTSIRRTAMFLGLTVVTIGWGAVEAFYCGMSQIGANIERDRGYAIGKRLREISRRENEGIGTVIIFSEVLGDDLPTTIPQPVLWSYHQANFGTLSREESQKRYYQQIYFQNYGRKELVEELRDGNPYAIVALFDAGKVNRHLSAGHRPLIDREIEEAANKYEDYINGFDPRLSPETSLSFAVSSHIRPNDMANIDRWYERHDVEVFEGYSLYRLRPRPTK